MEPIDYLKQNAPEMATVVETYLVEETVDLIYDNEKLDKWNELVSELGLTGQNAIRCPEKSPIPFMPMNQQLYTTFETLCPRKVSIDKYNASTIPVEILDLVRLSNKEQYFGGIEIWYDEQQKDPVCVAYSGSWRIQDGNRNFHKDQTGFRTKELCEQYISEHEYENCTPYDMTWGRNYWLIGRWADVKQSFAELKARAKERFIFEKKTNLLQEIKKNQRELDDLESSADLSFGI